MEAEGYFCGANPGHRGCGRAVFYRNATPEMVEKGLCFHCWHPARGSRPRAEQLRERADALYRLFRPRTAFDVGCGSSGALVGRLRELGVVAWGCDLSPLEGYWFLRGDFLKAGLPNWKFDLVTALVSLEYMEDPRLALRRAASLVRPGGVLLMTTWTRAEEGRPGAHGAGWWMEEARARGLVPDEEATDLYYEASTGLRGVRLSWYRWRAAAKSFAFRLPP